MNQENNESIKRNAIDYIAAHKIDSLTKELLNSVVENQSINPILSIISLLSEDISEKDLEKEGIVINKEIFNNAISSNSKSGKPKWKPLPKNIEFSNNSALIIKKFLTSSVFDKIKNVKTSFGGTISHIINIANKLEGKEAVGLIATDKECYSKMQPLFKPALEFLHQFEAEKALYSNNKLFGLENIDINNKRIKQFNLRINRNLSGFTYNPHAKEHTRMEIESKILEILKKKFPKGAYYDIKNESFKNLKKQYYDTELNFLASERK